MNVYEYVEDSKDGKRYFYFTGTSPDKIPIFQTLLKLLYSSKTFK